MREEYGTADAEKSRRPVDYHRLAESGRLSARARGASSNLVHMARVLVIEDGDKLWEAPRIDRAFNHRKASSALRVIWQFDRARCAAVMSARLHIMGHLSEAVRLRDLADITGLSQSQFGRAFKASTGISPYQWQLNARVDRAQQLLVDGKRSLAQIALDTGFSEQSHPTRVFRNLVGTTPRSWQRDRRK
jgi:AraC-like DNA-binding protein